MLHCQKVQRRGTEWAPTKELRAMLYIVTLKSTSFEGETKGEKKRLDKMLCWGMSCHSKSGRTFID